MSGNATSEHFGSLMYPLRFCFFRSPLLPFACQSVQMEFLAISPGVHKVEALTLVDIESGYSVNLRYVRFLATFQGSQKGLICVSSGLLWILWFTNLRIETHLNGGRPCLNLAHDLLVLGGFGRLISPIPMVHLELLNLFRIALQVLGDRVF